MLPRHHLGARGKLQFIRGNMDADFSAGKCTHLTCSKELLQKLFVSFRCGSYDCRLLIEVEVLSQW